MPRYIVDIQKALPGMFWTNTYVIEAADIESAKQQAETIVGAERTFHNSGIRFDRYRVSTLTAGDDEYVSNPLNLNGQWIGDQPTLPPFCTLNVVFETGANRPGRKYYRVLARVGDIDYGFRYKPDLIGAAQQALNALLRNGNVALFDRGGDLFINAVVQPIIGIHQLRRGSKRRGRPVIQ